VPPAFINAFRYDAYGQTCATWTAGSGSINVPWRFGGRILESAAGSTDLYDFSARSYDPSLGAFTSFDTLQGSALNPLTLNRYLYANANPATLVDPDGHCAIAPSNRDEAMWCAAHADTTYGQAGPTGRTPADNVRNASRSTRATSRTTPISSTTAASTQTSPALCTAYCGSATSMVAPPSQYVGGEQVTDPATISDIHGYQAAHQDLAAMAVITLLAAGATACVAFFEICGPAVAAAAVNFGIGSATTAGAKMSANYVKGRPVTEDITLNNVLLGGAGSVATLPAALVPFPVRFVIGGAVALVTDAISHQSQDPGGPRDYNKSACQLRVGGVAAIPDITSEWRSFEWSYLTGVAAEFC
jgi:RHS repeat-associated protein